MAPPRALMLVSDLADGSFRADVARGFRPCPEYLQLERAHGVELLDWSQLPLRIRQRSWAGSLLHAACAARRLDEFDVVFSDGEHVGIPLALMLQAMRSRTPHLMLGHHITTAAKRRLWRLRTVRNQIDRLILHSQHQIAIAETELELQSSQLRLVPYFADAKFWCPRDGGDEPLVVSAGREHRDYASLAAAAGGQKCSVVVAAGSLFSPRAHWDAPRVWPSNFSLRPNLDRLALRDLYARASVIAVPLLRTDFQAGVTTVLEAMAMAKPVIVSATASQVDIIEDGVTGVLVPPQDPAALRNALLLLLGDPQRRKRIGHAARAAVEARFSLEIYSARLASHLEDLARSERPFASGREQVAAGAARKPVA